MAKNKIQHMTPDGVVHTRQTARTYTHVVVAIFPEGIKDTPLHPGRPDGHCAVWGWVGRPDLVRGALANSRRHAGPGVIVMAEPINGGTRPA